MLFTSIPYEKGWKARINGKKVDTIEVLNSLLAVPLTSGMQTIELSFTPKGFIFGLILSILAFITMLIIDAKRRALFK